jgi:signal transduction histidine kinase
MDQIVSRMMDIVFHSLFIEKGYVMLKTKDEQLYVSVLHKEPMVTLSAHDPFIRIIAEKKKGITRYDIEENPALQENKDAFNRIFNHLDATLILPVLFEDRLFGLLVLGEKKSGRFYKREDILLLGFLTDQAAVAMENARLQQAHVEALEKSKNELEQLNKAKSKTLDLLSHELKTPLSVIAGSVKRLQRESGENGDPQKRNKIFRRMEMQLDRLYDIQESTDKIIRFHRETEKHLHPEAQKQVSQVTLEKIELYPLAQRMMADARKKANHREISYELQGPENLSVSTHPIALEDAMASLLRNAVENTPDEGLVRILLEKSDNEILFKVKDFGVGISHENRKYLFDAFYHTRETDRYATRRPYDFNAGGRGLSLFRIRSSAEQFGFGFFMDSTRCRFLAENPDPCPGRISMCPHCKDRSDCMTSGGSTFWLSFSLS